MKVGENDNKYHELINPHNVNMIPLIPDVAILFRCSDILHFGTWGYGFIHHPHQKFHLLQ